MADEVTVIDLQGTVTVIETEQTVEVLESQSISVVSVGTVGPAGPAGASGTSYEHVQSAASALWVINHNLGYKPNVTIIDTLGRTVIGDLTYPNYNTVLITFTAAFSGSAFLS